MPPLRQRGLWLALGLALLLNLAATVAGVVVSGRLERESLTTNLLSRVKTAAASLDLDLVRSLRGDDGDTSSPGYRQLLSQMRRIIRANPDMRYSSLFGRRGDRVIFLVDASPEPEGADAKPGDVYPEATPELLRSFDTGASYTEGPDRDRWGTWMSGVAPVRDPGTGRVLAMYNMDADATVWFWRIAQARMYPVAIGLLIAAILLVFARSVYRLRDAAARLAQSESRFRDIATSSADWMWETDAAGKYLYCSDRVADVLGYTPDEMVGRSRLDFMDAEEARRAGGSLSDLAKRRAPIVDLENRSRARDGRTVVLLTSGVPVFDGRGNFTGYRGVDKDITVRRRALDRVEQLSRAVEATAEGVVVTDVTGTITDVNPGFCRITGFSRDEAVGKNPRILKSGKTDPAVHRDIWATITSGRRWGGEMTNRRKDGTEYQCALAISPIPGEDGRPVGFVAVQRDVTQEFLAAEAMRRHNRELDQARRAAEAGARAKSEFLANMSHEIRTPLNAIIGMTGLLLGTKLDATQREFADIVHNAGDALLGIINDILDFSKIEAGRLDFEQVEFSPGTCAEDAADLLARKAQEKGLEIAVSCAADLPPLLSGDPGRVRQVLVNLISNAVKFTDEGEVEVSVRVAASGPGWTELRFEVRDTGIGIPADRLGLLFQSFSQVDSSTTRRFGGTGLGLAISRRLVELMGGQIGVESEPGKGSLFWFTARLGSAATGAPARTEPLPNLRGLRVLITDDNAVNRRILREMLHAWGCRHGEASDGTAALAELRGAAGTAGAYQLVLLDHHMPGMDGEQLARAVSADPDLAGTVMILLTSATLEGKVRDFANAGIAASLAKPVKQSVLYDLITRLAPGETGGPTTAPADTPPAAPADTPAACALSVLVVEDNKVNQMVARRMLERLGIRGDLAANGVEAVEAAGRIPYDVILMDCQMPEMDGYEATREIRRREAETGRRTLIVAMTAEALKGDRERCLAAGMDDYLPKPVQLEQLRAMLERHIPGR